MICENLKKIRIKYKKSQVAVADLLDIPVRRYVGMENGESLISDAQLIKLAVFYQCAVAELKTNNSKRKVKCQ